MENVQPVKVTIKCPKHGSKDVIVPGRGGIPLGNFGAEKCPECQQEREVEEASAMLERKIVQLVREADIPFRYAGARIDQAGVPREVRRYAGSFPHHLKDGVSMLIVGPGDTGKTYTAVALIIEIMTRYKLPTRFQTVREICHNFRKSREPSCPVDEEEVLESLMAPDLLVIDGLGHERDDEIYQIDELIERRYNYLRPTIVTTRLPYQELGVFYPKLQSNAYQLVELEEGNDWRRDL